MTTPNNAGLQSEIDSRCPCFAMPASECTCTIPPAKKPDYEQMLEVIQSAYYWLQQAHKLMESQGIDSESADSDWPQNLADAVHCCGEVVGELDLPFLPE